MFKKSMFHSFSKKLFVCIFSTAFILLAIGLVVLYRVSIHATTTLNNQMMEKNLNVTVENLNTLLSEADRTAQITFSQSNILSTLKTDYSQRPDAYNSIENALITATVASPSVRHVSLCDHNNNLFDSSRNPENGMPYKNLSECLDYLDNFSEMHQEYHQSWYFLTPDPFSNNSYCFTNVRYINLMSQNSANPLFLVSISENYISSIYDFLGENCYIMFETGTIISAVNKDLIGSVAEESVLSGIQTTKRNQLIPKGKGTYYAAMYIPSISSYLVVDYSTDVLNATNMLTAFVVILIIILGLLFSVFWSAFISKRMTTPLLDAKECIERVRDGDLSVRCSITQDDEIGYLCESFNHMMDSLEDQIEKHNVQQNIAKENELRLLHSQINPHLLYNSLDSALYLMTTNNTARSIEILETLSTFFKSSLQRGSKVVTLKSSLEHIEHYIKLQQLCRSKDFELIVQGPDQFLDIPILHMLLQPIVENSVLHGFGGSYPDGIIEIFFQKRDKHLQIRITDDGMGISSDELQRLRTSLQSAMPPGNSFGLWNVAQRMRMYYGEDYGLSVDSVLGEYTAVNLEIPVFDNE